MSLAAAALGCAAPKIAVPVEIALPVAPSAPPEEPSTVSVTVARAPARLALDGDPAEWDFPRGPGSHVAVAVTGEGALLALDLTGAAAARGVWVGLGSVPLPVGPNGHTCAGAGTPEQIASCEALHAEFEAFTARHEALFRRLYRVDSDGVQVAGERGALTPVPAAQVVWRRRAAPTPGGATAEVRIPLAALPRVDQAPLADVTLYARAAEEAAPPAFVEKEWTAVALPAPVGFQPGAALREKIFEVLRRRQCDDVISYQPGDPDHLIAAWTGSYPLYTRQTSAGDVEIGYALANPMTCTMAGANGPATEKSLVVVLHRGEVTAALDLGRVMGVVPRGGALHVIDFASGYSDGEGFNYARWGALPVAGDGTIGEDLVQPDPARLYPNGRRSLDPGGHASDLSTFFVRGGVTEADPQGTGWVQHPIEVSWRWDAKARAYTVRERALPGTVKAP